MNNIMLNNIKIILALILKNVMFKNNKLSKNVSHG